MRSGQLTADFIQTWRQVSERRTRSKTRMYSELECGICYRTFNAGRRCPRELQCKHSFCESCLLALSRSQGPQEAPVTADRSLVCPFCRHTTSISGEGRIRAELRVDECVLERLFASGVLDLEDPEEEVEEEGDAPGGGDDREEATLPETPAQDSGSLSGSRGGRFRRSCRKVWKKISGKGGGQNCMTGADMRNLAMMSCYMF